MTQVDRVLARLILERLEEDSCEGDVFRREYQQLRMDLVRATRQADDDNNNEADPLAELSATWAIERPARHAGFMLGYAIGRIGGAR